MKTEKILEKMFLMQALEDGARDALLIEFINELKVELLKDEAKRSGKAQAKKAADNIIKQFKNIGRDSGAFIDEEGRQIIGGRYSAVRLYCCPHSSVFPNRQPRTRHPCQVVSYLR